MALLGNALFEVKNKQTWARLQLSELQFFIFDKSKNCTELENDDVIRCKWNLLIFIMVRKCYMNHTPIIRSEVREVQECISLVSTTQINANGMYLYS